MRLPNINHSYFWDDHLMYNFRLVWPVINEDRLAKYILDEFAIEYQKADCTPEGRYLHVTSGPKQIVTHVVALFPRWTAAMIPGLSHECCHAALAILDERNFITEQRNDEAFAYLQAYLLRKCLAQLN